MDAVHLYVDIQNFEDILSSTEVDGVTAHKRALRFLDLHQRAVHRILRQTDTLRVDFHGQRLHAVVTKPYGEADEATRVHRAVAIAQLAIVVLAETGDDDQNIPDAEVRVGIDTGRALVVNNGRSGYREPLFLGRPANMAAKLASRDGDVGIYLTNEARRAIDLDELDDADLATTPLTAAEIVTSVEVAKLDVSKDAIVKGWRKDNEDHPIAAIAFSRATPPIRDLDILSLKLGFLPHDSSADDHGIPMPSGERLDGRERIRRVEGDLDHA
jgi:class 3 adenylate cyclase